MYSMQQTCCLSALLGLSVWAAIGLDPGNTLPPTSWAFISLCVWLAYTVVRPERRWDRAVLWGIASSFAFCSFLAQDPSFRNWGDIYFFCGPKMQYCTCNFRWNMAGWYKAMVLWNFVLSVALGFQRLVIQLGLSGLLPGEEVVTRESFISICWRLIPYWLNNWEQQWGAECSSMMFELPHFAVELLIILPCVQILCSRMKVLAMPSVNAALPPGREHRPEVVRDEYVPNVLRGCWERQPKQRHLWHRIRANKQIISFSFLLCLMAGLNALYVPLHLEGLILQHPGAAVMQVAGQLPKWQDAKGLAQIQQSLQQGELKLELSSASSKAPRNTIDSGLSSGNISSKAGITLSNGPVQAAVPALAQQNGSWAADAVGGLLETLAVYKTEPRQCPDVERFRNNVQKHHEEILRMQDPAHRVTIPLVEVALALMRLSTEKFFVLMSLYVAFLLFRIPPRPAAYVISLNAKISSAFARLILYSFPAVCWVYGAGFIFSTFVSVVFWGAPLVQLYDFLRSNIYSVSIKSMRPATVADIERMHGDCAICWCEMTVAPASGSENEHRCTHSDNKSDVNALDAHTDEHTGAADNTAGPDCQLENAQLEQTSAPGHSETGGSDATDQHGGDQIRNGSDVDEVAADPRMVPTGSSDGYTLACGHAYHHQCLNQWLQQCHGQGVTPTCPMCQAPLQLHVQWHLLGPRQQLVGNRQQAAGRGARLADGGVEAANNYLLEHQPRLADMLAEMPNILAQENVQLFAEVQDLRIQRQQLVGELQLRQQQLQELAGRQQQMELEGMEMEQQRRQLLQELQLLRRARDRQRQLQQLQQAQPADQREGDSGLAGYDVREHTGPVHAGVGDDDLAAVGGYLLDDSADGRNLQRCRQLEEMLEAFIGEQEAAGRSAAMHAAAAASASSSSAGRRDGEYSTGSGSGVVGSLPSVTPTRAAQEAPAIARGQ